MLTQGINPEYDFAFGTSGTQSAQKAENQTLCLRIIHYPAGRALAPLAALAPVATSVGRHYRVSRTRWSSCVELHHPLHHSAPQLAATEARMDFCLIEKQMYFLLTIFRGCFLVLLFIFETDVSWIRIAICRRRRPVAWIFLFPLFFSLFHSLSFGVFFNTLLANFGFTFRSLLLPGNARISQFSVAAQKRFCIYYQFKWGMHHIEINKRHSPATTRPLVNHQWTTQRTSLIVMEVIKWSSTFYFIILCHVLQKEKGSIMLVEWSWY